MIHFMLLNSQMTCKWSTPEGLWIMNILEWSWGSVSSHPWIQLPTGVQLHALGSTPIGWSLSLLPESFSPGLWGSISLTSLLPGLFPLLHTDRIGAQALWSWRGTVVKTSVGSCLVPHQGYPTGTATILIRRDAGQKTGDWVPAWPSLWKIFLKQHGELYMAPWPILKGNARVCQESPNGRVGGPLKAV